MMSPDELRRRRDEIVAADGPWTAFDLDLGGGVRTMDHEHRADDARLAFVAQTLADVLPPGGSGARVLDIACLEAFFSIELARQGFDVVGVDVRAANLRKARFAADALGLENVRFVEDDARALSRDKYGTFDAVLCLGILQHLDGETVPALVQRIGEMCTRVAIFDTQVGFLPAVRVTHDGREYQGETYVERRAGETEEEHRARTWASIDNVTSFWPTKRSLLRMLAAAGFTTVFEAVSPPLGGPVDRVQLVAIKGAPVAFAGIPPRPPVVDQLPELSAGELHRLLGALRVRVFPRLPRWTREAWRVVRDRTR